MNLQKKKDNEKIEKTELKEPKERVEKSITMVSPNNDKDEEVPLNDVEFTNT